MLDYIKTIGFKYSTIGALTISMGDIDVPHEKEGILARADAEVAEFNKMYYRGLLDDDERYELVIKVWKDATDELAAVIGHYSGGSRNNVAIMAKSGARGSTDQIRQLAGMRGLMSSATGRTIEIPIKSNFREGLSVQEFFISTHGSRKGLSDTALRTADSGYLTRRLVDVAQDVIVREEDCGTDEYILAEDLRDERVTIEEMDQRIIGKYSFEDLLDPQTGELIVRKNEMITEETAEYILKRGITQVKVRSVLGCKTHRGVCAKCYGRNLATGKPVNAGEAVGIIAAQSIGEPGTQLTMRTFHTGGIAVRGLPRVSRVSRSCLKRESRKD